MTTPTAWKLPTICPCVLTVPVPGIGVKPGATHALKRFVQTAGERSS